MRKLLLLFIPYLTFSQNLLHSNYIDLGDPFNAYSHGDIKLVEDIDFTTTQFNDLDAQVCMYERHLWNSNPVDPLTGFYQVFYTNPQPVGLKILRDPADNYIDNGGLHLKTTKVFNQVYSFHNLTGAYSYRYGIYEFEAKLTSGYGLASAFFMYSDRLPYGAPYANCDDNGNVINGGTENKNWQEIDVWEMMGDSYYSDKLRSDLHYSDIGLLGTGDFCNPSGNVPQICEKCNESYRLNNIDANFFTEYHKFTLYWDPHYIITLVDGNVYRYWTTNKPNPVKYGDPQPSNFVDAMYLYLSSHIYDLEYNTSGDLHGINPGNLPSSDELTVKSFKHWVFLPCFQNSTEPGEPVLNNIKEGNRINMGLFETGDLITIEDTKIEPGILGGNIQNWLWGEKLILMATKKITLKPGFSASGSAINKNYPNYPEFFKAEIVPCGTITNSSLPTVNNMGNGNTYLEQFWGNMPTKISESYNIFGGSTWMAEEEGSEFSSLKEEGIFVESSDEEIIVNTDRQKIYSISVYGLDGRLVNKYENNDSNQYEIQVLKSDFNTGAYLFIINNTHSKRVWID